MLWWWGSNGRATCALSCSWFCPRGRELDHELTGRIRTTVRTTCTPRHVPAKVLQVPDIPRTLNGKKVEIAVTRIIHGEEVRNRDALANPESLDAFRDLPQLSE